MRKLIILIAFASLHSPLSATITNYEDGCQLSTHNSPLITLHSPLSTLNSKLSTLQHWYTSKIGIREKTGNNDGPEIERWLAHYGLGKGYSYCSAFVGYGLDSVGIRNTVNAWSPTSYNTKNVVWDGKNIIKKPRATDVISLWSSTLKRISHTGFFDKDINGTVYESVEANTNDGGSFNGDGVYRKKRSYKATYRISRWE